MINTLQHKGMLAVTGGSWPSDAGGSALAGILGKGPGILDCDPRIREEPALGRPSEEYSRLQG